MHAQQALPGFQNLQQHHAIHQADQWQNGLGQRLQALQRETTRLQQEMGNIEQRSRSLASAHPAFFNAAPPPPQIPQALQHLLQQEQNERASADGRHGVASAGSEALASPAYRQPPSGRASPNVHRPDHTSTYSREAIGPNGERWQMTVNETTSTFQIPQQPLRLHDHPQVPGMNPALDTLQALARNTDRLRANLRGQPVQDPQTNMTEALSSSLSRTASNPQQAQFTRGQPTNPSSAATFPSDPPLPPQLFNPVFSPHSVVRNTTPLASLANDLPRNEEPNVYILSSPEGPQALLVHNSDTYYTPRRFPMPHRSESPVPQPFMRRRRFESPAPAPVDQAQPEDHDADRAPGIQDMAAQPLADPGNHHLDNNPLEPIRERHGNPVAGALGARIGPLIWLIIRLAGFVWFFTAGNNSWPRFIMITALAVVVFIINTGIFNGVAEAFWAPVRRHVEALIPLAGPEAALVPAVNAAAIPRQQQPEPEQHHGEARPADVPRRRRRRGELDEAEVAARMILQQRAAGAGWWQAQIRRIEHAALLFLASLVPGVGERHIAAREAAANAAEAERQRETEAQAAAENPQGEHEETGSHQVESVDQNEGHGSQTGIVEDEPAAAQQVVADA